MVVDNYVARGRRTLTDVQCRLDKHFRPHFGELRLTEITTDVVDAFVAARKKAGATNSEINRELGVLKRAFSRAIRARVVFAQPHIEMLKEPAPRSGFFEYPEVIKVRDLLSADIRPLISSSTSPVGAGIQRRGPSSGRRSISRTESSRSPLGRRRGVRVGRS